MGWAIPARRTGPTKVRGTAPGKVKWSYEAESFRLMSLVGVQYTSTSWAAWMLNDSSTLV